MLEGAKARVLFKHGPTYQVMQVRLTRELRLPREKSVRASPPAEK